MNLDFITAGDKAPDEVNVVIEIPAHSDPIKYEMDKDSGALFVDRFIGTGMRYPCNYGYIPHTLAKDGDPSDVLVITPFPVMAGAVVRVRPIAMLNMEDESGLDNKILAVPVDKLSKYYSKVQTKDDCDEVLIAQIEHFFEYYKLMEPGKWVKIAGWADAKAAKADIVESMERYTK